MFGGIGPPSLGRANIPWQQEVRTRRVNPRVARARRTCGGWGKRIRTSRPAAKLALSLA
jgi:hypothetical protein